MYTQMYIYIYMIYTYIYSYIYAHTHIHVHTCIDMQTEQSLRYTHKILWTSPVMKYFQEYHIFKI